MIFEATSQKHNVLPPCSLKALALGTQHPGCEEPRLVHMDRPHGKSMWKVHLKSPKQLASSARHVIEGTSKQFQAPEKSHLKSEFFQLRSQHHAIAQAISVMPRPNSLPMNSVNVISKEVFS